MAEKTKTVTYRVEVFTIYLKKIEVLHMTMDYDTSQENLFFTIQKLLYIEKGYKSSDYYLIINCRGKEQRPDEFAKSKGKENTPFYSVGVYKMKRGVMTRYGGSAIADYTQLSKIHSGTIQYFESIYVDIDGEMPATEYDFTIKSGPKEQLKQMLKNTLELIDKL